jgi:hypothetical protein
MLGLFKRQTGTKVKMVVEYELDYDEKINKDNVNDIIDIRDILKDPNNITGIRDVEFKTIKN